MSHFFVTGHTGFKGAWLTQLLVAQGHEVSGFSLDPGGPSLFDSINLSSQMTFDFRGDIRDLSALEDALAKSRPEFVFHLAAQALVRKGYADPINTYTTNFLGTLNVLVATARSSSVKAQLIVTSDKVYKNKEQGQPFEENDPLQGGDPYSQSKASADQLAGEWLNSGRTKPGAIARAGNVIGAGDYAQDRLLPDFVRAVKTKTPLEIRYPGATRPWQHVLDCVFGYVTLLDFVNRNGTTSSPAWNFGPNPDSSDWSVRAVLDFATNLLESGAPEVVFHPSQLHEHSALTLNSRKASFDLKWKPRISVEEAIEDSIAEARDGKHWNARNHISEMVDGFLSASNSQEFFIEK